MGAAINVPRYFISPGQRRWLRRGGHRGSQQRGFRSGEAEDRRPGGFGLLGEIGETARDALRKVGMAGASFLKAVVWVELRRCSAHPAKCRSLIVWPL